MTLELLTTQKAPVDVSVDDGNGNLTPLGGQFHFTITPAIASIENQSGSLYVVAQTAGEAVLHITSMDGTLVSDTDVVVTDDPTPPPPPAVPFLVVTFGTPVPK